MLVLQNLERILVAGIGGGGDLRFIVGVPGVAPRGEIDRFIKMQMIIAIPMTAVIPVWQR